jgi:hypothetical protein
MNMRLLLAWGFLLGLALSGAALAQPTSSPLLPLVPSKPWSALTQQQQQVLSPLAAQWPSLPSNEREHWLALAAQYPTMQADVQARFRGHLQDWARMSPAERLQVRQGFQVAQKVTPAEREAKWAAYQQLPPDKRQALQERALQRAAAASQPQAPNTTTAPRRGATSLQPGQHALAAAPWATAASAHTRKP